MGKVINELPLPYSSRPVHTIELLIRNEGKCQTPKKAHKTDAGIDLRANIPKEEVLGIGEIKAIPTGIRVVIPEGYFGLIKDRSGLALKHGIHVLAGVVDAGYRGEIKVVLANFGKEPFKVEPCMRIAQMIILPIPDVVIKEVKELTSSDRGEGGFGSTGLR